MPLSSNYLFLLFLSLLGGWIVMLVPYPDANRYVPEIDQMVSEGKWKLERKEIPNYYMQIPGVIFCLQVS